MPKQSFRDLDDVDLVTQLKETKDELFKLRFQHATGQLTNYSRLGEARRDIARLETELRVREIAAAEAEETAAADDEETS
jgi:large subunit ribosomal protein L29